jgi:hypothetical protein
MSEEQVKTLFESQGKTLRVVKTDPGRVTAYFTQNDRSESVTFCDGLLFHYQYEIAGGLRAFLRTVARETERRGPAAYDARAEDISVGESLYLRFEWPTKAGDSFSVTCATIGDTEQVYVAYDSPHSCH